MYNNSIVLKISLSKDEKTKYDMLKKTIIKQMILKNAHPQAITYELLNLADGSTSLGTGEMVEDFHDRKLKLLEQLRVKYIKTPILCFCNNIHSANRLKDHFIGSETYSNTNGQLRRWNDKSIPLLIANPISIGDVNLSKGSHIIVFFSIPQTYSTYVQAISRLDGNGQSDEVEIFFLQVNQTIDQRLMEPIIKYGMSQDIFDDALIKEIDNIV